MTLNLILDGGSDAGARTESFFESIVTENNLLFFDNESFSEVNPRGLWVSNGTQQGTSFLTPSENQLSSGFDDTNWLSDVNGTLFFVKYTDQFGSELWKSNGTPESTQLVKDIKLGSTSPRELVAGDDILYFTVRNSDTGTVVTELWKSDGTNDGTQFVTVFPNNEPSVNVRAQITIDNQLYFVTGGFNTPTVQLWKSNGTEESTELVYDFGYLGLGNSWNLYNFNDQLYITGISDFGQDLWTTDGTTDGTQFVKGVDFQNSDAGQMYGFVNVGDTVYFGHDDGEVGFELWKTNGTAQSTQLVKDINPEVTFEGGFPIASSSFPIPISASINNTFFFFVPEFSVIEENGTPRFSSIQNLELWKSDGTAEGTQLVTNSFNFQNVFENSTNIFSYIGDEDISTNLITVDNNLLFTAIPKDGSGFAPLDNINSTTGLWATDGTQAGTRLIIDPQDFEGETLFDQGGLDLSVVASNDDVAYLLTEVGAFPDRNKVWSLNLNNIDNTNNNNDNVTTGDSLLNTPINRFQNSDRPGTYLFAAETESGGIRQNFPNFIEEGQAFKVAVESGDDLIAMNRFQNSAIPGTYLYAGEAESVGIRQNFPNFIEEGVAFYVYGGNASKGVDFYRLQNTAVPGTYLFAAEEEKNNILANFPQFSLEGVAFEVAV